MPISSINILSNSSIISLNTLSSTGTSGKIWFSKPLSTLINLVYGDNTVILLRIFAGL